MARCREPRRAFLQQYPLDHRQAQHQGEKLAGHVGIYIDQPTFQPSPGRFRFGEDDETALVPASAGRHVRPDPVHEPFHACVRLARGGAGEFQHCHDRLTVRDGRGVCRSCFGRGSLVAFERQQAFLLRFRLFLLLGSAGREGFGSCRRLCLPAVQPFKVNLERRREGCGRGKQALLKADKGQLGQSGLARWQFRSAGTQPLAIRRELAG
jgi:hypothetical protein